MPPNITTLPLWSLLCNVGGKDRNSFFPSFPHSAGHTRYVFQELPFSFLFCPDTGLANPAPAKTLSPPLSPSLPPSPPQPGQPCWARPWPPCPTHGLR